jgi:ATP-binding cassette subfamily B protein
MSILILVVYKIAVPKFKLMQKLVDRLNLVSRESLSGMMVIRAFNMERHEEDRFDDANTELTDTTLFVNRVMVVMMPIMMLIMNGLSLFIIWVGAHQIAESAMQVGDMMAFLQYTMQIVFAFIMLSMMFIMLPRAAVSADRIADVLETKPTIRDPEDPATFNGDFSPSVEFRNVSFRYPGGTENAICNVSFTAEPGKTTAFIGATGSGKSTVVNLIPRFYDVTEGEVLVGGTDVREVTQHDLRDQIGCVPQRATLFSGTIASNLRFADEDASDEILTDAVAIAQAEEFVDSRPEGMEAEISQGGANVSGGQKQRVAIARALVKRAPIYLFDDSFSALDLKTDARLRKALKSRTTGSTVILVSQRVSTIMNADQIIVLDDGTVAGKGTHEELLASCDVYREIATSQLTEEELS